MKERKEWVLCEDCMKNSTCIRPIGVLFGTCAYGIARKQEEKNRKNQAAKARKKTTKR